MTGNGPRRIVDFNAAYARVHGHQPRPIERQNLQGQVEAIFSSAGCRPERVIAEMDLECGQSHDIFRTVRKGESIVARAGRAVFSLTFLREDGGDLVASAFNNGRYEGEIFLSENESAKVWCGTLMDGRLFRLTLKRIASFHGGVGKLGCVELSAEISPPAYSGL